MFNRVATIVALVATLSVSATGGQGGIATSRESLRKRFGSPDDVFHISQCATAEVRYAENGYACSISVVIAVGCGQVLADGPLKKDTWTDASAKEYLKSLVSELAPEESRGKLIKTGSLAMGCCDGWTEEYERVKISFRRDFPVWRLEISFLQPGC